MSRTSKTGFFIIFACCLLPACAGRIDHTPLPEAIASSGEIPGYQDIRFYGDELPSGFEERIAAGIDQFKAHIAAERAAGLTPSVDMLALSGGSEDGAFGAGFLVGWSETGTRPDFDIVTGVSTGGLSAPFVFLGPEYDHVLEKLYTTTDQDDIFKACVMCGLFGGAAFADTKPLENMIKEHITQEVLERIAEEHNKGRRLWIATTNLDSGRPVIWNIGALANSGRPDALALFHKILLATSAIPAFFPPVAIKVEAEGETYTELHADGGATLITFLYPEEIMAAGVFDEFTDGVSRNLYVVLNVKNPPYYKATKPTSYHILKRALYITVQNKAVGDALRLYEIARRDGLGYHLIMIPEEFAVTPLEDFDRDYMRALFNEGRRLGHENHPWLAAPPGADDIDP